MKILFTAITMLLTAITALGQLMPADSVKVYFPVGSRYFDPNFADNRRVMDSFESRVRLMAAESEIDSIVVVGSASPDGVFAANQRLSRYRCNTVIDLIAKRTGVSRDIFVARPEGVAWAELRRLVATTPGVPAREEILDILDNTPVAVYDAQHRLVDSRKKQLMDLRGGDPYRWMLKNIFPELRNAVAVMVYLRSAETEAEVPGTDDTSAKTEEVEQPVADGASRPDSTLTAIGRDLNESLPQPADTAVAPAEASSVDTAVDWYSESTDLPVAIKTNLLYYIALMPNIEIEWRFHPNWSAALEGDIAWWSNKRKDKTYQLAIVSPEIRRWFNPRGMWHGLYAGVFVGGGLYDFENGGTGYQGHGAMAGLSVGYMWPIGRHLSLEAGVGAGYMHTRYKMYEPRDEHYIYLRTKTLNYFGPLKLKLSLVWRFTDSNKTKQINSVI